MDDTKRARIIRRGRKGLTFDIYQNTAAVRPAVSVVADDVKR